jgi:DNA polymerase (family X)
MPVVNAEITAQLDRLADLLDIQGANPFRVRAYRRAARLVQDLPRSVADMVAAGEDLDALPGIGPDLAGKIATLAEGRPLPMLQGLERDLPAGVVALLALPGLGPKRVHALHAALGIDSLDALAEAAKAGKLRGVPGFGPAMEASLLRALAAGAGAPARTRLAVAEQVAAPLLAWLRASPHVAEAEIAGSFRRRRETVGDLDIVVATDAAGAVMDRFTGYEAVARVLARGPTRSSVVLRSGLQVDLRAVDAASYGAALLYFTGSKSHNIRLRQIALDHGWKLNEYGLFKGKRPLPGPTEAALYRHLGLPPIPPELREDSGEVEAARAGRLPDLVTVADLRGDLHAHTDASDGRASLADMAEAAQALGHDYIAITDHSRRVTMAHGLDPARLGRQVDAIARLNEKLRGITVLAASEVDILADGKLDLPDSILRRLDLVVAAIHSRFELAEAAQTERVLRAMDNHYVSILAHPTGRLIDRRAPYALDMERVMRGALARGCFLEVNAQPERLDLTDAHCRLAKELGLKVAISTDAHAPAELGFLRFGVDQARRGWLEAKDVLNARPLAELRALLRRA